MSKEKKMSFQRVLWGFKPRQVQEEIARMIENQQQAITQYQQQSEQIECQLKILAAQKAELQQQIHNHQRRENLLADTLLNAQAEANQIVNEAHKEAEEIVYAARIELEQSESQLKALKQQQKQFLADFSNLYQNLSRQCSTLIATVIPEENNHQESNSSEYRPFLPSDIETVPEGGNLH